MDEINVNGPVRPAGTSPRVWHELRIEGGDLTLKVVTPDRGTIYEQVCPGGVIMVASALAFRAALASATEEGRQ